MKKSQPKKQIIPGIHVMATGGRTGDGIVMTDRHIGVVIMNQGTTPKSVDMAIIIGIEDTVTEIIQEARDRIEEDMTIIIEVQETNVDTATNTHEVLDENTNMRMITVPIMTKTDIITAKNAITEITVTIEITDYMGMATGTGTMIVGIITMIMIDENMDITISTIMTTTIIINTIAIDTHRKL